MESAQSAPTTLVRKRSASAMADARPSATATTAAGAVRTAVSADGSRIAYEAFGSGPPVILIGGALNDRRGRASGVPLARLLAPKVTAIVYDRRGRGDSTAAGPYSVAAEIAD